MSVQEITQSEPAEAEVQVIKPDGATLPAGSQDQAKANPDQDADQIAADKASKEAQDRDNKGRFKGVQPRIDELTRARHEAERESAYWKGIANSKGASSADKAANEKPTLDKFDDYGAFVEALTDWKADQAVTSRLQERAQAQQQETRTTSWNERQAIARTTMPDYDEVVGRSETPVSPHVAEAITDSESGPALAYHFANNPEVLTRLNGLSPIQAAREVGRIEATLAQPKAELAPTIKTTNAPTPAAISANQGRSSTVPLEKMSQAQYEAHRKSQGARWAR